MHDERLLERSIMARLLGLLSSERFAREMSAVTRVIVILQGIQQQWLSNPAREPRTHKYGKQYIQ